MEFPSNNERITCEMRNITNYYIIISFTCNLVTVCPSLAIQTFSYFQIKLTQSLLNPSLQRVDQGNISSNSTPHYRSVLSETVRHDKTFGLELYRSSQRTNTLKAPLKAPEVIHIC